MAASSNKFIPILGIVVVVVIGSIVVIGLNGDSRPQAQSMDTVPLPPATQADQDTPEETLTTVVASNNRLRDDIQGVIAENRKLQEELRRIKTQPPVTAAVPGIPNSVSATAEPVQGSTLDSLGFEQESPFSTLGRAFNSASNTLGSMGHSTPAAVISPTQTVQDYTSATVGAAVDGLGWNPAAGAVHYKVMPPMGYQLEVLPTQGQGQGSVPLSRYVRTWANAPVATVAATQAVAMQAAAQAAARPEDVPYFTLPENATLAGVTAMTSLIGRVPIDGRVTDPMQFKAIVGRDNLAANGWELPDDIEGMVVTGIAIGDMALSCTEGKVRSITFVFNDGSIRTVSGRSGSAGSQGGSGSGSDLGFISDLHGNPCIQGKFVTNAPAYLTDIIGIKSLGIAAEALAEAQTTRTSGNDSGGSYSSSSVTGNVGRYTMGRSVSAATDELATWLTQRLKNSFDAVVTPAGQALVVHLDKEIRLDKSPNARRIVHRNQTTQPRTGARYGLE